MNAALAAHPNFKVRSKHSLNLRPSMCAGHNLWVLKPNNCNRGRGVHIFSSLDQLKKLIHDYTHGVEVPPTVKESKPDDEEEPAKPLPVSIIKSDVFVIQKYIEKPLLVKDRKFDIRLWVLLTQDHKCYLFKEGYARMTSYKYSLDEEQMDNLAVHLTNNAIQKKDKNYGREEDGNILSYK